eukprot:50870_1
MSSMEHFSRFDKESVGLTDDRKTMTMKKKQDVTVYGNMVIPYNTQKIHQWRFTIKQSKYNCADLSFGIDEASYKSLKNVVHWNVETNNYVRDGTGCLYSKNKL